MNQTLEEQHEDPTKLPPRDSKTEEEEHDLKNLCAPRMNQMMKIQILEAMNHSEISQPYRVKEPEELPPNQLLQKCHFIVQARPRFQYLPQNQRDYNVEEHSVHGLQSSRSGSMLETDTTTCRDMPDT